MQRLLARLQADPVLQGLTAEQLKQCDAQQRTRVFAALLCRSHTGDKVALAADLMRRPPTQFLEITAQRLLELGCPHPCSAADLEHQRAACYRAFAFLADLPLASSAPASAPETKRKPMRRQPAAAAPPEDQTNQTAVGRAAARVAQRQKKGPALRLSPPAAGAPSEGKGRTKRSVSARASRPSSAASRGGSAAPKMPDWVHPEVLADASEESSTEVTEAQQQRATELRKAALEQRDGANNAARQGRASAGRTVSSAKGIQRAQQGKEHAAVDGGIGTKAELLALKAELQSMRAERDAVIAARDMSNVDSRRLMLLASQNAQLQRQVDCLAANQERTSNCLALARAALEQASNMEADQDTQRALSHAKAAIKGMPTVPGTSESPSTQRRFEAGGSFLADADGPEMMIPRVFSGDVQHLDFNAIHALEERLTNLQPVLAGLTSTLRAASIQSPNLQQQTQVALQHLERVSSELSTLAFLVPSHPRRLKLPLCCACTAEPLLACSEDRESPPCCWAHSATLEDRDWVTCVFEQTCAAIQEAAEPPAKALKKLASMIRAALQVSCAERRGIEVAMQAGGLELPTGLKDAWKTLKSQVGMLPKKGKAGELDHFFSAFRKAYPHLEQIVSRSAQIEAASADIVSAAHSAASEVEGVMNAAVWHSALGGRAVPPLVAAQDDWNVSIEAKPLVVRDDWNSGTETKPLVVRNEWNSGTETKPVVVRDDWNTSIETKPVVVRDDWNSGTEIGPEDDQLVQPSIQNEEKRSTVPNHSGGQSAAEAAVHGMSEGDPIEARYSNGEWYPAMLVKKGGKKGIVVQFNDGVELNGVSANHVKRRRGNVNW